MNVGFDIHKYKYKYFISHFLIHDSRKKKIFIWLVTVMSVHQTGPRCRRIPYQQNTHMFSSRHVPLLLTHNALGLGLHRQPSYNHYITKDNTVKTTGNGSTNIGDLIMPRIRSRSGKDFVTKNKEK